MNESWFAVRASTAFLEYVYPVRILPGQHFLLVALTLGHWLRSIATPKMLLFLVFDWLWSGYFSVYVVMHLMNGTSEIRIFAARKFDLAKNPCQARCRLIETSVKYRGELLPVSRAMIAGRVSAVGWAMA